MRVGIIDVDGHGFPNLALMKLSAWHKEQGDSVEWYEPITAIEPFDRVYMSKVFSFTPDYQYGVNAKEVIKGGTGYCFDDGAEHETFCPEKHKNLPDEIEHIYPDYEIYGITDTAYGFLTRGCPRGCEFCIVAKKEGQISRKVADLTEWWSGQKHIVLLDPNIIACKDWKELIQQLIDSKADVVFNQGVDIRLMTEDKARMLMQVKTKQLHFAWDRYQDKDMIIPKFEQFKRITSMSHRKAVVYVLTNKDTTFAQDLERVMTLRSMATEDDPIGYNPYIMIYEKYKLEKGSILGRLQRWCNNRVLWHRYDTFDAFQKGEYKNFIEY